MTLSDELETFSDEKVRRREEFAAALRELRLRAGNPSLRTLSADINASGGSTTAGHSILAEYFMGKRLPSWRVASEVVRTLGGNEDEMRSLWMAANEARHVSSSERQNDIFTRKYLKQVIAFAGQLRLPSLTIATRASLDNLYVEQCVTEIKSGTTESLWSLDDKVRRAVLLGDPGSGKTTACQAIMYRHTQRPNSPIPFLVTMREYFSSVPLDWSVVAAIEHTAETFFQTRPPDGYVTRLLSEGRALVIFDGLDELLLDAAARSTSSAIELFCEEFPKAQVIVTSRPSAYPRASLNPKQFKVFMLEEFSLEQINEYLHKWFSLNADLFSDTRLDEAESWLSESGSLAEIRANPLFLSLAAQLYSYAGAMPGNAVDLIRGMSDLLLRQIDQARGIDTDRRITEYLEPMLGYLAFQMLDKGSDQIDELDLVDELTKYLNNLSDSPIEAAVTAQDFLDVIRKRSWLLSEVGITPSGESRFMFTHRTFQEYFAANYIVTAPDPAAIALPRLTRPEWRSAFDFVLALADRRLPGGSDQLLRKIADEAHDLEPEAREQVSRYLVQHWPAFHRR